MREMEKKKSLKHKISINEEKFLPYHSIQMYISYNHTEIERWDKADTQHRMIECFGIERIAWVICDGEEKNGCDWIDEWLKIYTQISYIYLNTYKHTYMYYIPHYIQTYIFH